VIQCRMVAGIAHLRGYELSDPRTRDAILACLHSVGGNRTEAARHLGMSRATIYRKIRDYGIVDPID